MLGHKFKFSPKNKVLFKNLTLLQKSKLRAKSSYSKYYGNSVISQLKSDFVLTFWWFLAENRVKNFQTVPQKTNNKKKIFLKQIRKNIKSVKFSIFSLKNIFLYIFFSGVNFCALQDCGAEIPALFAAPFKSHYETYTG